MNRMLVFDAAPPDIRAAANARGDAPLTAWWNDLQEHQRQAVLDGKPLPERRLHVANLMDIFWTRF